MDQEQTLKSAFYNIIVSMSQHTWFFYRLTLGGSNLSLLKQLTTFHKCTSSHDTIFFSTLH